MDTWRNQIESIVELKELVADIKTKNQKADQEEDTSEYGEENDKESEQIKEIKP